MRTSRRPAARSETSRAEKLEATRRALFDAAVAVVAEHGYQEATIARITARAAVAQGTFYNYFSSQTDLFQQLLPQLGTDLLDFIRAEVEGVGDSFEREAIGFRAFFDFLRRHPGFHRIMTEAEIFAPEAYRAHIDRMVAGYLRALTKAHEKGELPGFAPAELEVVTDILLGARHYITMRHAWRDGEVVPLPRWVSDTYVKFITAGMRLGGLPLASDLGALERLADAATGSRVGAAAAERLPALEIGGRLAFRFEPPAPAGRGLARALPRIERLLGQRHDGLARVADWRVLDLPVEEAAVEGQAHVLDLSDHRLTLALDLLTGDGRLVERGQLVMRLIEAEEAGADSPV